MSSTWNRFKRMLTWTLATALVLTSVPATAFAAEPVTAAAADVQTADVQTAEVTETASTVENGGVEDPSADDAVVEEEKKEDESKEAEEVTADDSSVDTAADEEESDEIIEVLTSEESSVNKFEAGATGVPKAGQEISVATLYTSENKAEYEYKPKNYSLTNDDDPGAEQDHTRKVVITAEGLEKNAADGSKIGNAKAYYVGIEIPDEYDDYKLELNTNSDPDIFISKNKAYFKITKPDKKYTVTAEYGVVNIVYNVSVSGVTIADELPDETALKDVKVASVSKDEAAGAIYKDAAADGADGVFTVTPAGEKLAYTQITQISENKGFYVAVAVPNKVSANDAVTAKWAKSYEDKDKPSIDKPSLDGKYGENDAYTVAYFDIKDEAFKGNGYIWVTYTWTDAGLEKSATYKYTIDLSGFTKDTALPTDEEIEEIISGIKAAPVYVSADSVSKKEPLADAFTVGMAEESDVAITADALDLNLTGETDSTTNDQLGYNVGIAIPNYQRKTGKTNDSVSIKAASAYTESALDEGLPVVSGNSVSLNGTTDNVYYDLYYFNVDDAKSATSDKAYVRLTFTDSHGLKKSEDITIDLSGVKIKDTLPTRDELIAGAATATVSTNGTTQSNVSAAVTAGDDDNTIDITLSTSTPLESIQGFKGGSSGYWVGVEIPALSSKDGAFKAKYAVKKDGEAPEAYNEKLNTVRLSDNSISDNHAEEDYEVDNDVRSRIAYFDVNDNEIKDDKTAYIYVKYTYDKKKSGAAVEKTYTYKVDFSNVRIGKSLPEAAAVDSIIAAKLTNKSTAADVLNAAGVTAQAAQTGTNEYTVSVNATALPLYTLSENNAANAGYYVGVAFPRYGTGVSENNAVSFVTYYKADDLNTLKTAGQNVTSSKKEYYVGENKDKNATYYDAFYTNVYTLDTSKKEYYAVEYKNTAGDSVRYLYTIDYSNVKMANGLPTLTDVKAKGFKTVSSANVSDSYWNPEEQSRITDDGENTITVSVNASTVYPVKTDSNKFNATVEVPNLITTGKETYKAYYKFVTTDTDIESVNWSGVAETASANKVNHPFALNELTDGKAYAYVKLVNNISPDGNEANKETVTYKYVIDFSDVYLDVLPDKSILTDVKKATLSANGATAYPYDTYSVTAGTPSEPDENNVITVPVTATATNLKLHQGKNDDTVYAGNAGMGYWIGIDLPKTLTTSANTVKYYSGFEKPKTYNDINEEAHARETVSGIPYNTFLFDAADIPADKKGYVAVEMTSPVGGKTLTVIYEIDFSGVTLAENVYDFEFKVADNTPKLFKVGEEKTFNLTVSVNEAGDKNKPAKNVPVVVSITGQDGVATVGDAGETTKTTKTDDAGKATVAIKVPADAKLGVASVNAKISGMPNEGGSYGFETYKVDNTANTSPVKLVRPDDTERTLDETYTLSANSAYQIYWQSSDEDVATVDQSGKVSAKNTVKNSKDGITVTQSVISKNSVDKAAIGKSGKPEVAAFTNNYNVKVYTELDNVEIKSDTDIFYVGKTDALYLSFDEGYDTSDASYGIQSVAWSSLDDQVATISNTDTNTKANITGKAGGTARVTATIETQNGLKFKVRKNIEVQETPGDFTINYYEDVLGDKTGTKSYVMPEVGKSIKLDAVFANKDISGADYSVTWSSGDQSVATINSDGYLTAKKLGEAVISAETKAGTRASFTLTVGGYRDIDVAVQPATVTIGNVGDNATITPVLTYDGKGLALNDHKGNIYYSSSDESVATVVKQENGTAIITAKKKGTADVTVSYNVVNAKKTTAYNKTTVQVKVGEKAVDVKNITLSDTEKTLYTGASYTPTYTVAPADYTDTTFVWSSSSATVAAVDPKTGMITAGSKAGSATITLSAKKNDEETAKAELKVNVIRKPYAETLTIAPKAVTLKAPVAEYKAGESVTLKASTYPADVVTHEVKWSSLDTSVATVDDYGKVTAVKAGTATITGTIMDGVNYATSSIVVTVVGALGDAADDLATGRYVEDGAWIGAIADEDGNEYTYTGAAIKPEPNVYYGDILLTKGVDYTLAYKNNINAARTKNRPTVTVRLKGNYSGTLSQEFTILPKDLGDDDVTINNVSALVKTKGKGASLTYVEQTLNPVITFNGKTLKNNTDYELFYYDDDSDDVTAYASAGTYSISIKGIGNYAGDGSAEEILVAKDKAVAASKFVVDLSFDQQDGYESPKANQVYYTGSEIMPKVSVYTDKNNGTKLTEDSDYYVTVTNNKNLGTATVTVTGTSNADENHYFYGQKKVTFKIVPKVTELNKDNTGKLMVQLNDGEETEVREGVGDATTSIVYAKGGAKPASVVVKYNGTELKEGVDFKWANKNVVNKTTKLTDSGTVTITGMGKFYKGKATVTYKVVPQSIENMTYVADDFAVTAKTKSVNLTSAKITVYDLDGKALKKGTDYTLEYYYADGDKLDEKTDAKKYLPDSNGKFEDVTVKILGVNNYDVKDESNSTYGSVTLRFSDESTVRSLKKAKYFFNVNGEEIASNKYYVKYAGTPVVLSQDDLIIKVNQKVGRTNHWVVLDNNDYEIVAYANNNKAGTSTITIRGVDDYAGLLTLKFKISK